MKHVSIDVEVLGNGITGLLLAIGAIEFNPATGWLGKSFHMNVDMQSSIENGGAINGSTVEWWFKQSDAARESLFTPDPEPINHVLRKFKTWLENIELDEEPNSTIVWGNGIRSDNVWVAAAYERALMECPFKFWQDGDIRSLVLLDRAMGYDAKRDTPFEGVPHNPLHDAIHQAKYLSTIWQRIIK